MGNSRVAIGRKISTGMGSRVLILTWVFVLQGFTVYAQRQSETSVSKEEALRILETVELSFDDMTAKVTVSYDINPEFKELVGVTGDAPEPLGGLWKLGGSKLGGSMEFYDQVVRIGDQATREQWAYDGERTYVQYDRTHFGIIAAPGHRTVVLTPNIMLGWVEHTSLSTWLDRSKLLYGRYEDGELHLSFKEIVEGRPQGRWFYGAIAKPRVQAEGGGASKPGWRSCSTCYNGQIH